ncbi:hypothetical protein GIB67_000855 [Kingdonia uniflora]|uniref:SnRK1-interacting protein 1 n=1 Tax=Kingdonia uniflora TaxID=39325 RepID=A0A7J7LG40_9MAGN|nr:hypothetical protein GIB67_000855 [Kingdonia uniflora]
MSMASMIRPLTHHLKSKLWKITTSYLRPYSNESLTTVPETPENSVSSEVSNSKTSQKLPQIIANLSNRVPDLLLGVRTTDGVSTKHVPWHNVIREMKLHTPEWSGEVRSVTYSADGRLVTVAYRLTLYGTDGEIQKLDTCFRGYSKQIYREARGSSSINDADPIDPVRKAEALAIRAAYEQLELTLQQEIEGGGDVPTSGISRPLAEVLKELSKRVPDSLIKVRMEDGFAVRYVPWHIVNRIMNLHAPEWSGEVRSVTYSADGKSVSVIYRVTLYGTDAEIHRESSGSCNLNDTGFGDPVQKAEAMAFRRACARLGLGLHLYHEDML